VPNPATTSTAKPTADPTPPTGSAGSEATIDVTGEPVAAVQDGDTSGTPSGTAGTRKPRRT
jgi:hypothetical protein